MKILTFVLIWSLLITSALGQKEDEDGEKLLSDKYYSGPYLVYDCQDKHWVCTDKEAVESCNAARKRALERKGITMPCFVVKEYKKYKGCLKSNKKMINQIGDTKYCYHPDYLQRVILYQ